MEPIKLKPGMMFGTRNPMLLGRLINANQWFWSRDGESTYSHSGIIESSRGNTYEALWSIKQGHLKAYDGQKIIVAQYMDLDIQHFREAMIELKNRHHKQWYPWWRMPMFLVPPLAKFGTWRGRNVVCSELVAELLALMGLRHNKYTGTTPDILADEWRRWQGWKTIEGRLHYEKVNKFFID